MRDDWLLRWISLITRLIIWRTNPKIAHLLKGIQKMWIYFMQNRHAQYNPSKNTKPINNIPPKQCYWARNEIHIHIYIFWASTVVNVRHVESACLFSVSLLPVVTYRVCKCMCSYMCVWNIHSFIYLRRSCVSSVHHGWQIDFAKHCMRWPFIMEEICRQFLSIKCKSVRLIKLPVVLTQAHVNLRMNW